MGQPSLTSTLAGIAGKHTSHMHRQPIAAKVFSCTNTASSCCNVSNVKPNEQHMTGDYMLSTCLSEGPYAARIVPSSSLYAVAVRVRPFKMPRWYRCKQCVTIPAVSVDSLSLAHYYLSSYISKSGAHCEIGEAHITLSDLDSQATRGC